MASPPFFFFFSCSLLLLLPPPSLHVEGGRPPMRAEVKSSLVDNNSSFVLAADRTYRKDPFNGLRPYSGGWNISDNHYWASVGFTAVPLFLFGILWFIIFGVVLLMICCCYFCCPDRNYSYSRVAYGLSLILLILFTIAAMYG